jgi:hypothetical protein
MSGDLAFANVLDRIEVAMASGPELRSYVVNRFTPGLYIRECGFEAGTQGVTMIHAIDHPFFILKGDVEVISETEGVTRYVGPCMGITKCGTRRLLKAHADTVWITVHPNPNNETDIEKIVARITQPHENPAVPADKANMWRRNQTVRIE